VAGVAAATVGVVVVVGVEFVAVEVAAVLGVVEVVVFGVVVIVVAFFFLVCVDPLLAFLLSLAHDEDRAAAFSAVVDAFGV